MHSIVDTVPTPCGDIKRGWLIAEGLDESAVGPDHLLKEDTRGNQLLSIGSCKDVGAAIGFMLPSLPVCLIKGRDHWLWTTEGLWSGKFLFFGSYSVGAVLNL